MFLIPSLSVFYCSLLSSQVIFGGCGGHIQQHSGFEITHGRLQGPNGMPGSNPGQLHAKQKPFLQFCCSSPSFLKFFMASTVGWVLFLFSPLSSCPYWSQRQHLHFQSQSGDHICIGHMADVLEWFSHTYELSAVQCSWETWGKSQNLRMSVPFPLSNHLSEENLFVMP